MSKLYVGNLSYTTTDETLKAAFAEDGREVRSVTIIMDRETGRSRGFAFVEMASPADAEAAITAMDGREVDGRNLRVNEARETGRRGGGGPGRGPGGPRGGFGGGGGGRGPGGGGGRDDRGRGGGRGDDRGRGGGREERGRGGRGGRRDRDSDDW